METKTERVFIFNNKSTSGEKQEIDLKEMTDKKCSYGMAAEVIYVTEEYSKAGLSLRDLLIAAM